MIIDKVLIYIDKNKITKSAFEKKVGLSNGYLSNIKKSGSEIQPKMIEKILKAYPLLESELESRIDNNKPINSIPLIPIEAMAGYSKGEMRVLEEDVQERYVIPEFSRKGVKYIVRVSGSSMYPKYSNGDLLGCKPIEDTSFFQWGKPYVLDTDQGPLVKRLYPVDDKKDIFECRSDNFELYPPFQIHRSSIYRIAIVVGVIRQE